MKTLLLALFVVAAPMLAGEAQARQYAARSGRVVHTRRAPVVMHRIVPPFKGVHVYQGGARR